MECTSVDDSPGVSKSFKNEVFFIKAENKQKRHIHFASTGVSNDLLNG